jgi:hypothetical protein
MRPTSKFRHERKYHLTEANAMLMRQRASYLLTPDKHTGGSYQVSSVYFDDAHDTSLHEKRNGVFLRDKWRLRYYNNTFKLIHLERKHKRGELARKEHAPVTEEQYAELCRADMRCAARQDGPVWRAFYARHLLGCMRPVVTVWSMTARHSATLRVMSGLPLTPICGPRYRDRDILRQWIPAGS